MKTLNSPLDIHSVLQRKKELEDFLLPYRDFYSTELLNRYPFSLDSIDPIYIEELLQLTDDELYEFDCRRPVEKLKNTRTQKLVDSVKSLSSIPEIEKFPEIPLEDWAFKGVKFKKRHEIQKIIPVLKKLNREKPFHHIVDIGGGVGHLARTLAHYHGIESVSLDTNQDFQEQGKKRAERFRKLPGAKPLTFINLTFGEPKDEEKLKKIVNPESLVIGLHTCGNLANDVMKTSLAFNTFGLLSFGCCYHKMDPEKDFPQSKTYSDHSFKMTLHSLTLATRDHGATPKDEYTTKRLVKFFRYILHFWLCEKHQLTNIFDVGENNTRDYHGNFSDYAIPKLVNLGLALPKHEELDVFYLKYSQSEKMQKLYVANLLRWQLGRALEIYLLLDRACYLIENGYHVQLESYFDESLSPRNIGILAYRP